MTVCCINIICIVGVLIQFLCVHTQNYFLDQIIQLCKPSILEMFPNDFDSSVQMYLSLVDAGNALTLRNFKLSNASRILSDDNFNDKYKTCVYVHGYLDMPMYPISDYVVQGYRSVGRYNIILYDMKYFLHGLYPKAVKRIPDLGKTLGKALAQMFSSGFDINNLEVIGHSLGAHVAGFAGKTFYKITKRKLPIIIGLDVARPCLEDNNKNSRFDADDAEFVEAIHTNAGMFGVTKPVGSVDIYINGGKIQPGYNTALSHIKAISYWLKAVQNPKRYKAQKCKDLSSALLQDCNSNETITMGQNTDRNARGIYHLEMSTNET